MKKESTLIDQVHDKDINLEKNEIFLVGIEHASEFEDPGIEYAMTNRFIRNMALVRDNPKPLLIHLKSVGGSCDEGMAMYDTIRAHPQPVTILAYAQATSMSSVVLQAANKRVIMPNCYFMVHDGQWGFEGTVKEVASATEFSKRFQTKMMDIYVNSMRVKNVYKDDEERELKLRGLMDKKGDVYMSPEQAVETGFADAIFDGNWKGLTKYTKEQRNRIFV